jgi:hypothetical protein
VPLTARTCLPGRPRLRAGEKAGPATLAGPGPGHGVQTSRPGGRESPISRSSRRRIRSGRCCSRRVTPCARGRRAGYGQPWHRTAPCRCCSHASPVRDIPRTPHCCSPPGVRVRRAQNSCCRPPDPSASAAPLPTMPPAVTSMVRISLLCLATGLSTAEVLDSEFISVVSTFTARCHDHPSLRGDVCAASLDGDLCIVLLLSVDSTQPVFRTVPAVPPHGPREPARAYPCQSNIRANLRDAGGRCRPGAARNTM